MIIILIYNYSYAKNSERIEVVYYSGIDGDTAKFKLNDEIVTVRFLGINTPESEGPYREEEAYGKEASNNTKKKLENAKKIEIEYDSNASSKDKYDRILAWVWVDDKLIEEELIKEGYAKTYMLQDNYKYADILKKAEKQAKESKIGIWSDNLENAGQESNNDDNSEYNITFNIGSLVSIAIIIIIVFFSKLKKK